MMYLLEELSDKCDKQEFEMLKGIIDGENGFSNPAYKLSFDEYKNWIKEEVRHSQGVGLPPNWVPYTTYILYVDNIPVGYGRVRHRSDSYLETVVGAGNLGYGISKQHRGKGYGSILFQELLKQCRKIGYNQIKLFPLKTNEATIKIMLKNGGKIVGDFNGKKHVIEIPLVN